MHKESIAVRGSGAHLMAVDLTDRGYAVHLYGHRQCEQSLKPPPTKGANEEFGTGLLGTGFLQTTTS